LKKAKLYIDELTVLDIVNMDKVKDSLKETSLKLKKQDSANILIIIKTNDKKYLFISVVGILRLENNNLVLNISLGLTLEISSLKENLISI
tara:strand:+ start:140 stop:412 length:273 start_codon:yes stop_codon:yes gene_type:complete